MGKLLNNSVCYFLLVGLVFMVCGCDVFCPECEEPAKSTGPTISSTLTYTLPKCKYCENGGTKYYKGYISISPEKQQSHGLITVENKYSHTHGDDLYTIPFHKGEMKDKGLILWSTVYFKIDCQSQLIRSAFDLKKDSSGVDVESEVFESCFPLNWHSAVYPHSQGGNHNIGPIYRIAGPLKDSLRKHAEKNTGIDEMIYETLTIRITQEKASEFVEVDSVVVHGKKYMPVLQMLVNKTKPSEASFECFYVPELYESQAVFSKPWKFEKGGKFQPKLILQNGINYPIITSLSIYHDHGQKIYEDRF